VTAVQSAIAAKRCAPERVLNHVAAGTDAIVGLGNGEPKTILDALEAGAERLEDVRLHQMLPLRDRPYIEGGVAGLGHVSWFSIAERTRRLIAAHPRFREELTASAQDCGYLR
jgi:acyl-CoA hydrolase